MNSYDLYVKTPPLKLFLLVSVPGSISMLAGSLWGLFDGIFVGQLLGETAFAALNLAFPLVFINFSLADLIGVGSSVPISIALGRKQKQEAANYFSCALLLILLTGIFMGMMLYLSAPYLISLMGAEGELADMATKYLQLYALFSPLTTIVFALDNFLRISGKIKTSMALNIVMSVLILGLEYFCLAVLKMDIGGSAIAVSVGMIICAFIALWQFRGGRLPLSFCRPHFSRALIRQIVANGSPVFLSNVSGRLVSILMNVVLLSVGGQAAVSIYGILMYAGDILQQLMYGACDSAQPAIGYNWGAGQIGRVKSLLGCCLAAGAFISLGGMALMLFAPATVVSLFIKPEDMHLLEPAVYALSLFSFTFLTRWFGFVVQGLFIALEKPLPAGILSVGNACVFPVLLLAVLWPLGLDGLWLNMPITSALVTVLAAVMLFRLRASLSTTQN